MASTGRAARRVRTSNEERPNNRCERMACLRRVARSARDHVPVGHSGGRILRFAPKASDRSHQTSVAPEAASWQTHPVIRVGGTASFARLSIGGIMATNTQIQEKQGPAGSAAANPFQTIMMIAGGVCLPRCLHAVANLGVADALDEAPRTAAQLAKSVGADPDALARVLGLGVNWNAFSEFGHSVKISEPATTETLPEGFWDYFARHPEEGKIFNEAMVAKGQAQMPAVVAGYDFSRFGTIADIGGGRGHLLQAIL